MDEVDPSGYGEPKPQYARAGLLFWGYDCYALLNALE